MFQSTMMIPSSEENGYKAAMTALRHLVATHTEWGGQPPPESLSDVPLAQLIDQLRQEYEHQAYLANFRHDIKEVGDEWLQQLAQAAAAGEMAAEQADIVRSEVAERPGRQQQQYDTLQCIRSYSVPTTRRLWSPHLLLPEGGAEHKLLFEANAALCLDTTHPAETYDKPLKWRTYVEQLLKSGTAPPGFEDLPAMPRHHQRIAHELALSYVRNAPLWMQLLVVVKAEQGCSAIQREAAATIRSYMSKRSPLCTAGPQAHLQMLAEERQAVTPVVMEAATRAVVGHSMQCALELIQEVVLRDIYGDRAVDTLIACPTAAGNHHEKLVQRRLLVASEAAGGARRGFRSWRLNHALLNQVQVYKVAPVIGLDAQEILQRIADDWFPSHLEHFGQESVELVVHQLDDIPSEVAQAIDKVVIQKITGPVGFVERNYHSQKAYLRALHVCRQRYAAVPAAMVKLDHLPQTHLTPSGRYIEHHTFVEHMPAPQ
jgi:hypothetical protein